MDARYVRVSPISPPISDMKNSHPIRSRYPIFRTLLITYAYYSAFCSRKVSCIYYRIGFIHLLSACKVISIYNYIFRLVWLKVFVKLTSKSNQLGISLLSLASVLLSNFCLEELIHIWIVIL